MRIAFLQGKREQATEALSEIESLLNEKGYPLRFIAYDIAVSWYYYILRMPEKIPNWLKGKFTPCAHPIFLDNFGNQMKARYHYLTKDYPPLLAYMEEQKKQTQVLFGQVELLAIEACVRYQMKDKTGAFITLRMAYELASPNEIVMPFFELGKDMRTLILAVGRDENNGIPKSWLERITRKSAYYAKQQGLAISDYNKANKIDGEIELSSREKEILRDLYNGLSQSEIATKYDLSKKTIEMVYKNISIKLGAANVKEIIRIAGEKKLV